jgi:hypothetical protein
MPFTPYHLGPALALGLPFRKRMHAPTFIIANVILDVEPLLVLLLGLDYPLHGYAHTFLMPILLGCILGYAMFLLEGLLRPLHMALLLESSQDLNLRSFLMAGISGTMLHVLMDSPLYPDIRPFFPSMMNPLFYPSLTSAVYDISFWMGILSLMYYVFLVIKSAYGRVSRRPTPSAPAEDPSIVEYFGHQEEATQRDRYDDGPVL